MSGDDNNQEPRFVRSAGVGHRWGEGADAPRGETRRKYAAGGLIEGEGGLVRIERLGVGPDGMCLYSINGGRPERIYTADDVRKMGRGEVSS